MEPAVDQSFQLIRIDKQEQCPQIFLICGHHLLFTQGCRVAFLFGGGNDLSRADPVFIEFYDHLLLMIAGIDRPNAVKFIFNTFELHRTI